MTFREKSQYSSTAPRLWDQFGRAALFLPPGTGSCRDIAVHYVKKMLRISGVDHDDKTIDQVTWCAW